MKHPAVRLLLCVCVVFSILQPVYGVSRLFVDELTGYTTEQVTADDVRTDLMIVNTQTVDGSVTANSPNSHTVDTPGSIAINTANTNIEIANDINIETYGENVRFAGENVLLGAGTGDFINTAIHQSIVATETVQLLGGNFEVDGEHVKVRTAGEIFFTSDLNFNVNVEDKVEFLASHITFEAADSTTINSEQSNVHFKAGDEYSITGSNLSLYGESGARILAQQGDLNIVSSNNFANLVAENIQLDGISQSALISENGDISAYSLNLNIESDRTIIGADTILALSDGDFTAVSFGVIQSNAAIVSINTLGTVALTPEDQLRITAATDILAGQGSVTWNADSVNFHANRDIHFSEDDDIDINLTGGAVLSSIDGDYNINSPTSIDINSFNSKINAIEGFTLSTVSLQVNADNYIDILADGDVNITSTTFNINTSEFEVFARESAQLSSRTDAQFSSTVNPLNVESSADINVAAPTGYYFNSANSIQYSALNLFQLKSGDDVYFNTAVNTLIQTRASVLLEAARDLDVNANTVNMEALNFNINTFDLFLEAYSVTFTTSSIGEFSLVSKDFSNITLNAYGEDGSLYYQAVGDVEFYSQDDILFQLGDFFDIIANDVVVSSEAGLSSSGDNLLFAAPTIYGLIQTTFETDEITFVGSTSFTAPTSRTNTVSLTSPTQNYDFFTTLISGGKVNLVTSSATFDTDTDIILQSANEQDITFVSSTTTSVTEAEDFNIEFVAGISFETDAVTLDSDDYSLFSKESTSFHATNSITIDSPSGQNFNVGYGKILFEGDEGVSMSVSGDFSSDYTHGFGLQAFDNSLSSSFTMRLTIAEDLNIQAPSNFLTSTASNINIASTSDIHSIFHRIDMDLEADMTIDGDFGFTIDATNTVTLHSEGDIQVTSPAGINAEGGDILVTGDDSVTITNTGDVTIGSNPPTISSPNYHTVIFAASEDLIGSSTGFLGVYASGNEEYNDEAITIDTQEMTVVNNGDFDVTGDNGINVAATSFSAVSNDFIYLIAENGAIRTVTQGAADALTIESPLSGSIAFVSNDAGLSQIAFDAVNYEALNAISNSVVESSKIKTLYDNSPVDVHAQIGFINVTVGGDYTLSNGDAQNLAGSLTIDASSQLTINTKDDLRFHTLAREDATTTSLAFVASNTLSSLNSNSVYLVNIANAINYYPSGNTIVHALNDATFVASNGPYSFGTTQGDAIFNSLSLSYHANRDYNMTAGGVNGEIDSEYGTSAYTAASNYNVNSNSSTTIHSNALTMSADRHIRFTTFSEETGVYGSASSATFQSESASLVTGVNVTGNAVTFSSDSSTNLLTSHFTIGQNNAQFNPQINGHVNSWDVNSIGSNQLQSKDDIFLQSGSYSSDAATNTIISAGGALEFASTWNSLVPGDGILSVVSSTGQITVNANNGYIDYHVRGHGVIHSEGQALIQASSTSTSSPSTSGILFRGTNGNIAFDSALTFSEDITTSASMDVGDDGVLIQAGTNIALSASTGSSHLRSDQYIYAPARFNTAVATTGNNARMEITTTGERGALQLHGDSIDVQSQVDGIEFNGAEIYQFTRNSVSITTGDNNNGQMAFDSSGDLIIHSIVDTDLTTQGDFYIEASGSASDFHIQTSEFISIQSDLDSTFSTLPGEGGSIRFFLDDNELLTMTGDTWSVDSDLDFNVATNGSFVFSSGGKFDTAVTGYIDINSEKSIALRSTDDAGADVVFHANAADVIFGSVQSTDFVAGSNGYGNATFVISGDASFTANGNFSSTSTSSLLIESLLGDSVYNSMQGTLDVQAYEHLSLLAFGSATDTGYAKFVSRSPLNSQNPAPGIIIESTHNGGDIFLTGIGAAFAAHDISFHATGTTSETGYINIVNDWDEGKGDLGTTIGSNDLPEVEDYPAVKFDSGTQTVIRSDTGDIHVNYGRRLLLRGGSVAAIASGGIQFNQRGQNRQIVIDKDDNQIAFDQTSSIDITQFNVLTFRTNNLGQGEIRVVAESSVVRAQTGIALIRNNLGPLMIQGSSAAVFRARPFTQFPGITFNSYDALTLAAFDDDIVQWGRVIRYGVLNNVGQLRFESRASTDGLAHFHSVGTTTFNNPVSFVAQLDGDYNIISTTTLTHTAATTYSVTAADNILLYYENSISFQAPQIVFQTGINPTGSNFNQKIQFAGSVSNDGNLPVVTLEDGPTVTMNTNLLYRPPGVQKFIRGAACEYERSIVFGFSQGVGNVCICLDKVWLCGDATNNGEPVYDFYKLPYQEPYFGTGPK